MADVLGARLLEEVKVETLDEVETELLPLAIYN